MATETFHTLIARNKRNSWLLIFGFLVFFALVGTVIGMAWGGGDVRFGLVIAAAAAGIGLAIAVGSFFGGSNVLLGFSRAKRIQESDDPELFHVVEEVCIAGGLPMPKVYIIDDTAMNAFATGRDPKHAAVAITRGLRDKLTRDELQGVMAHEMSHVRHYDIRYAMLMAVMVGVLVVLCDAFLHSLWWGAGTRGRRRSRGKGGGGAQVVILVVAIVLAILAPILARLIHMALSRQREYLADAGSVELTRNPQGLASALAKLNGDEEVLEVANRATAPLYIVHPIKKFEARASKITKTHPPIADRIQRLQSLGV